MGSSSESTSLGSGDRQQVHLNNSEETVDQGLHPPSSSSSSKVACGKKLMPSQHPPRDGVTSSRNDHYSVFRNQGRVHKPPSSETKLNTSNKPRHNRESKPADALPAVDPP